ILMKENKINDALIRMLLIGSDKDESSTLYLFPVGLTFYPKKMYRDGVEVITYHAERFMPRVKAKSLLLNYIAYGEARKKGAIDALLIDRNGNITEGTRTSFFAVKGNTLIVPPDENVLEGVTRKMITEIAKKSMVVRKENIPLEKIKEFDDLFITGTTIGIMPIKQIDDMPVGHNGEKVEMLRRLYDEYCSDKWM
ncbi:MAG: hypothetical protein GXO64_02715, partial [Candidatus Micrarchaeota archaeon]|nr:hypothetical protein [Candidatus Micrarchaeota archaeon]